MPASVCGGAEGGEGHAAAGLSRRGEGGGALGRAPDGRGGRGPAIGRCGQRSQPWRPSCTAGLQSCAQEHWAWAAHLRVDQGAGGVIHSRLRLAHLVQQHGRVAAGRGEEGAGGKACGMQSDYQPQALQPQLRRSTAALPRPKCAAGRLCSQQALQRPPSQAHQAEFPH